MLNLMERPLPGFSLKKADTYHLGNFKRSITSTGRHFLYLLSEIRRIERLADSDAVTQNVKLLGRFFARRGFDTPIFDLLRNAEIDFNSVCKINHYINELRLFRQQGEFVFYSPYGYRKGSVKFVFKSYEAFKKKLKDVELQYKSSKKYFSDQIKGTDVALIRYRFSLESQGKRINYDQFKKFFTAFNKQSQKAVAGIKGYKDFFYFLKEYPDTTLFQDIVVIFAANELVELDSPRPELLNSTPCYYQRDLHQEVKHALDKLLEKDSMNLLGLDVNTEVYVKELPILTSIRELDNYLIIIEPHEKEKLKLFYTKLLPYFVYLSTLEVDYTDIMNSRFSRGQKSNPS